MPVYLVIKLSAISFDQSPKTTPVKVLSGSFLPAENPLA